MGVINPVIMVPGALFDFGVDLVYPTNLRSGGSLNIGPGPVTVPDYCFYTTTGSSASVFSSLTGVSIPGSVTSIGTSAFYGWSSATSLVIPDSVTSIGNTAFQGWSSATSLVIPGSVTSIGGSAFQGWSSATEVYIYAATPPSAVSNSFSGVTALFHVPAGTIPLYQAATGYPNEIERYQEI